MNINFTLISEIGCNEVFNTCMENDGEVISLLYFNPKKYDNDFKISILSLILTIIVIIKFIITYFFYDYFLKLKGNNNNSNKIKNNQSKTVTFIEKILIIPVLFFILLFEIIFVHGIYVFEVPFSINILIYLWIFNNLFVFIDLILSFINTEFYRLQIYLPIINYSNVIFTMLFFRIFINNIYTNIDLILLLIFYSYIIIIVYLYPESFKFDNNKLKLLIDENKDSNKKTIIKFLSKYISLNWIYHNKLHEGQFVELQEIES
jgi:hypothetical protein